MTRWIMITFLFLATSAFADDSAIFQQIFTEWTHAFNTKNLKKSCQLFSKSLVANYQGAPEKNYQSICDSFKKTFEDKQKNWQYHFKIHYIYRENNLAAVRITWYLDIFENGKKISREIDEGLDIFKRNQKGQWQIVNYIAYPRH